jgi:hypothetical protein
MDIPRLSARTPRAFMEKYGGNVAGFFWNAGTALQFVFGLATLLPHEIISAVFNFGSPLSYLFFGHKNLGVVIGGICGIIGTFLAVYPEIVNGETGSIFGSMAFFVFVLFGIFSAPLTRRFVNDKKPVLRETLGHPRRLNAFGILICTRLPIIYESVMHGRWHLAAVFGLWGLGDLAFSFSKPKIRA